MQLLRKIWSPINSTVAFIEAWALTIFFVGMIICGIMQIVARFILHAPIAWSEEMLTYSFVWTTFLGASLAVNTLSHFNVDCLIVRLPRSLSTPILYFVWVVMAIFAIYLTYKGIILTKLNVVQVMDVLPLSMMWAYMAMPLSFAFMFIHIIERLLVGDFLPKTDQQTCTP